MVICINISIPNFHTNMKTCSRCGETKELSCFSKRSSRPSGVQSKCKDCEREVRRQYWKPHEKIRRELNISDDLFEELMKVTHCQTCGNHITGKKCIDHCHTTKEVRGILCHNCNTALGLIKDNKQTLQNMLDYL